MPCGSSCGDSSAKVIVVSGTNIKPSPTPRRMRGQKKSLPPLSPVTRESSQAAVAKISAPAVISKRGSKRRPSRPTTNIESAVATAPGNMTIPVCSAVMRRLLCRNTGRVNDIAYSPTPITTPRSVPTDICRCRKTRKSITGCSVVSSRQSRRMAPRMPITVRPLISDESNQSSRWPCSSTY